MACWLVLALPWIGAMLGIESLGHIDDHYVLHTWVGNFMGKQGDYYFATIFVSILGVKGFWLVKRIADILSNDHLAMNRLGQWGARKDFRN